MLWDANGHGVDYVALRRELPTTPPEQPGDTLLTEEWGTPWPRRSRSAKLPRPRPSSRVQMLPEGCTPGGSGDRALPPLPPRPRTTARYRLPPADPLPAASKISDVATPLSPSSRPARDLTDPLGSAGSTSLFPATRPSALPCDPGLHRRLARHRQAMGVGADGRLRSPLLRSTAQGLDVSQGREEAHPQRGHEQGACAPEHHRGHGAEKRRRDTGLEFPELVGRPNE